ncbi:hypothetical protein [Microbacterium excoecariae]|uniref:hypothetical protein n=1 Tax=Microbacterium excoecariae TaxID=2715210 RepID=UPI00140E54E0|nr:hypothetical protein [Microbacterium excoecariae]NHI16111.1 hypothetical protein [Microbacterium excoecariae]
MILAAEAVAKGPLEHASLVVRAGEVALIAVPGGQRPTLLGLVLSGRMSPAQGTVTLDGAADPRALRRRVALVDSPETSAPHDGIRLGAVVREELVFAGIRRPRRAARRLLADEGLSPRARLGDLAPAERTRVLARTAAARAGVDALVFVSPERHGGDAAAWLDAAHAWAARRYAVVVIASAAAVRQAEEGARA